MKMKNKHDFSCKDKLSMMKWMAQAHGLCVSMSWNEAAVRIFGCRRFKKRIG